MIGDVEQKVIARERLKASGFKQPHIVKWLIMISYEKIISFCHPCNLKFQF